MSDFRHRPRRPGWSCEADGSEWPCHAARKVLTGSFVGDEDGLSRHMSWLQLTAARDLGVVDPARLYQRFVRWTEPPQAICGRCEKGKHRAIAGMPPRLFPCQLQSR